MNLVIKDAVRQILGRVASALGGFLVIKLITPYLGPLRFGDYSTILKYFAIWSAFADFGIYVIALKQLGGIKQSGENTSSMINQLSETYSKFVSTRAMMIGVVYTLALVIAYLIPAYTSNPYLVWGLPLGLLFSASFMGAGILQIPLQLYRKMEQLSIGLILARVGQLAILVVVVFLLYPLNEGDIVTRSAFMWILVSVVASGVIQGAYVWYKGKDYLKLYWNWDRLFTKKLLTGNRQYGVAYYLSSFHTLIILMMLSWFYPTSQGFTYVGIWALSLGLIEILLIIPSALGNSLIHNVSGASTKTIREKYSNLCLLVSRIGMLVVVGLSIFGTHLIDFLGGASYVSSDSMYGFIPTIIGSDFLLPWLGFILLLSFIKQVHNYLFVTTGHQNALLIINLFGVVIGLAVGVPLVLNYQLVGGLIAQFVLEVAFLGGSLRIAYREKISLNFQSKNFFIVFSVATTAIIANFFSPVFAFNFPTIASYLHNSIGVPHIWLLQGTLVAGTIILISLPMLKKTARGL